MFKVRFLPIATKLRTLAFVVGISVIGIAIFSNINSAAAFSMDNPKQIVGTSNEFCLSCHETPDAHTEMPSGEVLNLFINGESYNFSVHGFKGTTCVECHTDISGYPHPELETATLREFTIQQNQNCAECHEDNYEATLDSVHQGARDVGNLEAAVCSDCHGAHDIAWTNQSRSKIPQLCENCHSQVYELYEQSVHGEALLEESNLDVPTCVDCHGIHNIGGPSQDPFHLFSPLICANCHADEALLEKYDLNPLVLENYVSDFHGTTVTLFEEISPDQETNKPVCIDCHGVHDIRKTDDPESRVIQQNLLSTCQRCHPNASDDFPSSWLSHYAPSWETTPAVSAVNLFYNIIIPVTVVGMLVFVIPDGLRRLRKRFKRDLNE